MPTKLPLLALGVLAALLPFAPATILAAGKTVETGNFPGYVVVPLARSDDNHLIVPTVIGSKRVEFAVDTGAPVSAIDAGVAQKIHLPPPPPNSKIPSKIANGDKLWDVVMLPNLIVRGLDLGGGPMAAAKGFKTFKLSFKKTSGMADGLFGNDILIRQKAILNCKTQQLFLNTDPSRITDPSATLRQAGYVRVPLRIDGHLFAPCKLKGKDFWIIVDSGASLTSLESQVVKDLGIRSSSTPIYSYGPSLSGRDLRYVSYENHELSVGGVPILQDITARGIDGMSGTEVIGLLGAEVLYRYGAIIDFPHKNLWLKPAPPVSRKAPGR